MCSGLDIFFFFLPRRDPVFVFATNTKRSLAFTPVLDTFSTKSGPGNVLPPSPGETARMLWRDCADAQARLSLRCLPT